MNKKEYLADGVYVEIMDGMLRLYTDNGVVQKNEIFMDETTIMSFESYLKRLRSTIEPKSSMPYSSLEP